MLTAGRRRADWRFEIEASYGVNDIEIFPQRDAADVETSAGDQVIVVAGAVNAIRVFAPQRPLRPYLGAGIGVDRLDYHIRNRVTGETLVDDTVTEPTLRLVAGVEIDLWRNVDLTLDYRFRRSATLTLADRAGDVHRTRHDVHATTLGFTYRTGDRRRVLSWHRRPAEGQGHYVHATLMAAFPHDSEVASERFNFDGFDLGTMASIAFGQRTGGDLRVEAEVVRTINAVDVIDFGGTLGEVAPTGQVRLTALYVNFLYAPPRNVGLFLGAGLGAARVGFEDVDSGRDLAIDDADTTLTAQTRIGLGMKVTPRLTVGAEFRLLGAPYIKLRSRDGRRVRTHHIVWGLGLGASYRLN